MKAFFEPTKRQLIIAPLRCGSTILEDNAHKYNLMNITPELDIDGGAQFPNIIRNSQTKTFLFREPFERLVSSYMNFVYVPHFWGHDDNLNEDFKLFFSKRRKKDFWDDLLEAMDLIKLHYKKDPHMMPQYSYFEKTNDNVDDYQIINAKDFREWMYLNFLEELEEQKPAMYDIPILFSSVSKIQKLHEICRQELYKEDYEYLESRVIDI
jgi:hypothetical protein